jgi:hypothetical protein
MGTQLRQVRTLVLVLAVLAAGTTAHADRYVPQVLFTLGYGSGDNQAGVSTKLPEEGPPAGPSAVAVGTDGTICIADGVNRCIKRFDRGGALLMRSKEMVLNPGYLAVDSKGNAYALEGAGLDILSKFAPDGTRVWHRPIRDIIPADVPGAMEGFCSHLSVGFDDTLSLALSGSPRVVPILDGDGRFVEAHEGYDRTPAGQFAYVEPVAGKGLASAIRIAAADGATVASYTVDLSSGEPDILAGAAEGLFDTRFDTQGGCYSVLVAGRDSPIILSGVLAIHSDMVVVRSDPAGRVAAYLRTPWDPFLAGFHFALDALGNIYHLAYGPSSVDVIYYELQSCPQVEETWELPPIVASGVTYVPLRMVAEASGLELMWDPAAGRAVIQPRAGQAESRPPVTVSATEEGAINHFGRLWISRSLASRKLDITLNTDGQQKVVYLTRVVAKKPA